MQKEAILQLRTLCENGQMDRALDLLPRVSSPLSDSVYLFLLKACIKNNKKGLIQAKHVHAHIARGNVCLNGLLGDYLVVTLAKCGGLEEAITVSAQLPHLTVFSSTAIICGYVDSRRPHDALRMHRFMQENGIEPNTYTFVSLFKACGDIPDLEYGMELHDDAHRRGLTTDVVVGNALISMYKNCGSMLKAEDLFTNMPFRSLITWNTMLSAYAELDQGESILHLYAQMQEEDKDDVEPDSYTYATLFKACGSIGNLRKGMELHFEAQGRDLTRDSFVGNTLVSMYGKCGAIEEAKIVFISLYQHTLVSWNAMLSALVDQQQGEKALLFYRQMQEEGNNPDQSTFAIVLQACVAIMDKETHIFEKHTTKMMVLEIGRALHADVYKKDYIEDLQLSSFLLNLYAKLGAVVEAEHIFSMLSELSIVAWNAMLLAYLEVGQGEKALQLYTVMDERGVVEDNLTFVFILQACSMVMVHAQLMYQDIGYIIHDKTLKKGFFSDLFISSTLVSMYGKCQALVMESENVFSAMCEHTVASWNAMLCVYVEHGMGEKALQLYAQVNKRGVFNDKSTIITALQACAVLVKEERNFLAVDQYTKVRIALELGHALHANSRREGSEGDSDIRSTLISLYGKCGAIVEAEMVFYASYINDVVLWSAMIAAYVEQDEGEKGLWLYAQMENEGVSPNQLTLVFAFQACGTIAEKKGGFFTNSMCLDIGYALHAEAFKKGFTSHMLVGNTIIIMYQKCKALGEATDTFSALLCHNIVSWNSMLSVYVDQGDGEKALRLYRQMQEECVGMDQLTSLLALQACSFLTDKEERESAKEMRLEIGQALHSNIYKRGYLTDAFVCSTLVSFYGKCGSIEQAEHVFTELPHHDVAMWTAMLSAYVDQDLGGQALQLYMQIQEEGVSPDQRTLVIALQACLNLAEKGGILLNERESIESVLVKIGHALHTDACNKGFLTDTFVASALMSMYGKCSAVMDAEDVFSELCRPDVVSCNEMMSVYIAQYQGENALHLYRLMQQEGLIPDQLTFVMTLQACMIIANAGLLSIREALEIGRSLHSDACKIGYIWDFNVGSALVTVYGKCGALMEAEKIFSSIPQPAVIIWNALYSAYVQQHQGERTLELYRKMQLENTTLDHATLICILQACSATGSLDLCQELHWIIVCAGCDWITFLETTLIHAYGSSGSMADAQAVFDKFYDPDTVSWNALLTGHASQANSIESFRMFEEMTVVSLMPDEVTFSSLLSACRHTGLIEGVEWFESMGRDYGITADSQHYETMVDLLGRAGDFKRIENMMRTMSTSQVNVTFLSCLLGACRTHGNVDLAKWVFESALTLQPNMPKLYVMMSNICADVELHAI